MTRRRCISGYPTPKYSLVQGYNDNSGLGPILAHHLASEADHGQILVLVMNELGDHQMENYFEESHDGNGGMVCQDETTTAALDNAFHWMDIYHRRSFNRVGGKYIPRKNESTCAIRVARTAFFKVRVGVG